jgi:hypothetical protein
MKNTLAYCGIELMMGEKVKQARQLLIGSPGGIKH